MNKTLANLLYIVMILVVIGGMFYVISFLKGEGGQCVKQPYIYGARKMGNIQCSCTQTNNPTCPSNFFFNDTSFVSKISSCGTQSIYSQIPLKNLTKIP